MDQEIFFQNFLVIGKSVKPFTRRDPFRTYKWGSSNNPTEITGTESFYSLKVNVRISRFLECKKLEHFLVGLPDGETQALYDFPGVLDDVLFTNLLRAKASLSSTGDWRWRNQDLQERVQILRSALGYSSWNLNLLYAYLGNLKYELILTSRRIRPFRKFSGYVKTPSTVGSKQNREGEGYDPEIFDRMNFEERDLVPFLLSPQEDYSLLGFSAESPIYQPFVKLLRERKEFPNEFKKLLLYRPI
jgi:hypothetical protein